MIFRCVQTKSKHCILPGSNEKLSNMLFVEQNNRHFTDIGHVGLCKSWSTRPGKKCVCISGTSYHCGRYVNELRPATSVFKWSAQLLQRSRPLSPGGRKRFAALKRKSLYSVKGQLSMRSRSVSKQGDVRKSQIFPAKRNVAKACQEPCLFRLEEPKKHLRWFSGPPQTTHQVSHSGTSMHTSCAP